MFGDVPIPAAADRAVDLGFAHLDVPADWEGDLPLPVGDRMAYPSPRQGCSCPAPPDAPGMWERAVKAYRRCLPMRMEPWGGSICNSVERVRAMLDEVPGLRLLVDTGHVAGWGEDPVELLAMAGHVQLRQARAGWVQVHPDEEGDVDFDRVFVELDRVDYDGLVSVEYVDLPGFEFDDPVGAACALAERLR